MPRKRQHHLVGGSAGLAQVAQDDGSGGQFTFGDDEFAFEDDEFGVGFGYVANRMIGHGDARANRLIAAVRECLTGG
jgi:hypothetical protein